MRTKLLLCLAVFVTNQPAILRADMGMFDSVEWLTCLADQIGVYQAERVFGPHSVTNSPQSWSCCFCTAEFKLTKALRGNPPPTFSRTRSVAKPELLGFHAGDTYVFFLVAEERLRNVRAKVDSTTEAFFSMWDYIWLNRPPGEENGVAIDHRGRVLTNSTEILKLVETSLKLPRASPGIDRWAYYYGKNKSAYPDGANFNFRVLEFPTRDTSIEKEAWAGHFNSWMGLVIPEYLQGDNSSKTNKITNSLETH